MEEEEEEWEGAEVDTVEEEWDEEWAEEEVEEEGQGGLQPGQETRWNM